MIGRRGALFLTVTLDMLCLLIFASPSLAANVPTVSVSTQTVSVIKTQRISIAKHSSLNGFTVATADGWMTAGSNALMIKDSPTDVACPVRIARDGDLGVFVDTAPYNFAVIDSSATYLALRRFVPQRAKVVQSIEVCGSVTLLPGQSFGGCSDTSGPQIVIVSQFAADSTAFVHEYGHNQGLHDLRDAGTEHRIVLPKIRTTC